MWSIKIDCIDNYIHDSILSNGKQIVRQLNAMKLNDLIKLSTSG